MPVLSQTAVVVSCNRYDFKEEGSGRSVKGANVTLLLPERTDKGERRGLTMIEAACGDDTYDAIAGRVPCVVNAQLGVAGVGKKTSIAVTGVEVVAGRTLTLTDKGFIVQSASAPGK